MGLKAVGPLKLIGRKARPIVILTALPDKIAAEKLAFLLVENQLAACVNIITHMESIYFWDGKLVRDQECKLFIKSSSAVQKQAMEFIKANHPYTVPEITVIGERGDVSMDKDYWSWVSAYVTHRRE